jgi:hypothetical protein
MILSRDSDVKSRTRGTKNSDSPVLLNSLRTFCFFTVTVKDDGSYLQGSPKVYSSKIHLVAFNQIINWFTLQIFQLFFFWQKTISENCYTNFSYSLELRRVQQTRPHCSKN